VLRLFGRPTIEGAEHIPRHGPVILAGNHLAVADCLMRWFYSASGQVPIDRSGGRAARRALDAASAILERGGVWGIYPEGTRSPDGRLHRGKTGTMRVALATGAPFAILTARGLGAS
jgi:1-acyl-sn-glycerol-3-phosphate acyltransferase